MSEVDREIEPAAKKSKTMPLDNVILKFAKLTERASSPTRGSKLAAGYDLYSAYDYIIPGRGKQVVNTDIQIALPDGCYGRVAPRSGLSVKHFIDVGAGVIDQDYRGNVGVVMFNLGEKEFKDAPKKESEESFGEERDVEISREETDGPD